MDRHEQGACHRSLHLCGETDAVKLRGETDSVERGSNSESWLSCGAGFAGEDVDEPIDQENALRNHGA